jgi:RND family efflux transporter MFP subunit
MRPALRPILLSFTAALLLAGAGCGKKTNDQGAVQEPQGTPVTVTTVSTANALVTERVLGRVESGTSPQVFPEVPGKVSRVLVDVGQHVKAGQALAQLDTTDLALNAETARADVARMEALLAAQQRSADRVQAMWDRKLVSQGMYDDSQAQLKSLTEQLAGARARMASAQRALDKARITAPVDGVIQFRRIAPGDFVDGKQPAFLVTSDSKLRIHLPFPEEVAWRLRPGLAVRLTSPIAPEQKAILARIDTVSPAVGGTSHAVEAIVHVANPGTWSEGASVNGEVVLAEHAGALMVPEVSVVRRPAGEVVYVVKGNAVEQHVVTTGTHQENLVEIVSGLQNGDTVVVDGAGFLTDKAPVVIRK